MRLNTMSRQLSPLTYSSSLADDKYRHPFIHDVEIQSITDDGCAVTRNASIRFEHGYLMTAIADAAQEATKRHDHPPGWDSLDRTRRPARPTIQVRIRESVLHYFVSQRARSNEQYDVSVPRPLPAAVDQLSKVLCTAGIDIQTLDRNPENAMRLAIMAGLVETLTPTPTETGKTHAVAALSKWRLMRVLAYIDAKVGESITLANLAATSGLSRMRFARQFRAATSIRPHEYVLRKRIERAQKMLTETPKTLVDIALSVGFQTQPHFTTVFKRIVGSRPSKWRRDQSNVI
jgi:AraC family transcriptional regulator